MKLIKLTIEGIRSFESTQVLDFSALGDGIFGIFGKTGSGKSTILDSIALALFGETFSGGKFINVKRKKASVSLEFSTENENIIVERTFENKDGIIQSNAKLTKSTFSDLITENVEIITGIQNVNSTLYSIIGFNKGEMQRCFTLPQGEFSEFLRADEKTRINILSNIFGISDLGTPLSENAKNKLFEIENKLSILNLEYQSVSYASDENLSNLNEKLSEIISQKNAIENKLNEKTSQLSEITVLLQDKEKLNELNNQYDNLISEKDEMDSLESEIEKNKNASVIQSDYERLKKLNQDKKGLLENVSELNEKRMKAQSEKRDAENDYSEFRNNYDEQIASLNIKLGKIKQLEGTEKEISSLKEKLEKIKRGISHFEELKNIEQTKLDELNLKIDDNKTKTEEIDIFIKNSKADVELGNALTQTKEIEKELILLNDFYKNTEKLYDKANDELQSAQNEYNSYIEQESKLSSKVSEIQTSIENAFEFEEIDSTNFNKIRSCDKQIEIMNKLKSKTDYIQNEISKLTFDKEKRLTKIDALGKKIAELQEKLTDYDKKITEKEEILKDDRDRRETILGENFFSLVSNRLRIGDNCPICGSQVIQKNYNDIFDLKPIENEISGQETTLRDLRFDRDKIFQLLTTLRAEYTFEKNQIDADISEIETLKTSKIVAYQEYIGSSENPQEKFEKLHEALSNTVENLEQLIDLQDNLREDEKNILIKKIQAGTIVSIITEELNDITDLMFSIQTKKAEREIAIYNMNKKYSNAMELKKQVAEGKELEVEIDEKRIEKENLASELLKLYDEKSEKTAVVAELNAKISILYEKKSETENQIAEKEQILEDGGVPKNSTTVLEQKKIFDSVAELKNTFSKIETKLESSKNMLSHAENEYNINTSLLNSKTTEADILESHLSNMMIENGFSSNEELEKCFDTPQNIKQKKLLLSNYRAKYSLVNAQRYELEKNDYSKIENVSVETLQLEKNELEKEFLSLTENIGKLTAEIEKTEKDNKKKIKLENDLKFANDKYASAKKLNDLVRNGLFEKYIANKYMEVITKIANKKLNLISKSQFTLKYENDNFVIIDNFSDEASRPATTLSGGEIFIVSLALSLALSETIVSSSNKKINFLFLDEGFGTLDKELAETVISALLKLDDGGIHIGLISHSELLEESLKNKVYISKTPSGSKIKIKHSL